MSKRRPSGVSLNTRKRRKNGLSTSTSVLDIPTILLAKPPVMRIWHTNTEDPTDTSRKSEVLIPTEPRIREADAEVTGDNPSPVLPEVRAAPARPKRNRGNDSTKTEAWLPRRPIIVDELLRRDGLQDNSTLPQCTSCLGESGKYRCTDCTTSVFYCASCIVCRHDDIPLHRLEVWNGKFFERTSLSDLDYCFYVGHNHTPCPLSDTKPQTILVTDVNGMHHLNVQFCTCTGDPEWVETYRQLLRVGWYPASFQRPKTAFTFDLLDTYHKVALQGKLNLYDFYSSILQKTDNCGRKKVIYRYHEMSRCARQWRSLKQIKRGAGGHTETSLASVPNGAFALECPACPHPGRNLPEGWDEAPEELRWLYSYFLAVDANFRLKLKSRGIKDPEINSGWSYFIAPEEYDKHISRKTAETEATGCGSDFHAVSQANSKFSKDYIASGVVACVCARHSLMQKNGVGDLQRGERYINTDYIVASVLKGISVPNVVISYDIACKWSIHHLRRFSNNHPDLNVEDLQFSYLIPKFHLPGHGTSCQTNYSFNFAKGVGRTHGETVEQGWANINLAALSTREMGPGARHLALDDAWSGWNWKKILGMGELLLRSLLKALLTKEKHAAENKKFDTVFSADLRQEWTVMIRNWEHDKSKPNPYTHTEKASNLAEVRRKLAEADEAALRQGTASPQVPGSVFIRNGLEIEEQQRQLAFAIKKKPPKSNTQVASTQEKRNALMRQIKRWQRLQLVYMPGANIPPLHIPEDDAEDNDVETAETVPLLLPSSLDAEQRKKICLQQVVDHERLLRMAQLQDSLIELRHTRKIRHKLLLNHRIQVAGQGQRANTRSRTVLNSVEKRIAKFVERYRIAYHALLRLDPTGDWRETYLELKDCDNRGPAKERDETGTGDGTYFRSWIWLPNLRVTNVADGEAGEEAASDEDINDVLRVEWTTSFARLERWSEEVELLQEEMRRVVMFLEWKSKDWLAKVEARKGTLTPGVQSGLRAYAEKQAAVYHDLAMSFARLWHPTLLSYGLQHSWATEYMTKHGVPLTNTHVPALQARGIFKFRLSNQAHCTIPTTAATLPCLPASTTTTNGCRVLEEADCSEDSGLDGSSLVDSDSEDSGLDNSSSADSSSEDSGLDDSSSEDSNSDVEDDWDDDTDL